MSINFVLLKLSQYNCMCFNTGFNYLPNILIVQLFSGINGLIIPGGGVSKYTSNFANISNMFFEMAKKVGFYFI